MVQANLLRSGLLRLLLLWGLWRRWGRYMGECL